MNDPATIQLITSIYAACNLLRIVAYLPQIIAVARDRSGASALSLGTWAFWAFSHAVTAIYCGVVANDVLLAGMMWANAAGAGAVTALATIKRREYLALRTRARR